MLLVHCFFCCHCTDVTVGFVVPAAGFPLIGLFGEGSMRLGKVVNNPNLPRNLSLGSSVLAIAIGVFWIVQAVFLR